MIKTSKKYFIYQINKMKKRKNKIVKDNNRYGY
jgi:hypothetical protein